MGKNNKNVFVEVFIVVIKQLMVRDHIKIDSHEMTKTSNQDKYVKNGMVEFDLFNAVQNSSNGISDTTCEKPGQSFRSQTGDQWVNDKYDHPTHENIH